MRLTIATFFCSGWQSLQLFEPIDATKIYNTHVHMKEGADKLWTGDIVIMNENVVVGMFGGVAVSQQQLQTRSFYLTIEIAPRCS